MTKLEELINMLIPDGVEFKELVTLAEIGTGSSDRKDAAEDGKYPFYVRSKDVLRINSFEYDEEAIVIPGEGGIGEIFHYVSGKYALHQRAYRIHPTTEKLSTRFLYYYMFANFKSFIMQKAVTATVTSIRKPMIEKFEVPVPPLEIQNEIVRILDNFTELEEELEEELVARRKQYEYYRDSLLSFDDSVEWKTLGDISTVNRGIRVTRDMLSTEGSIPVYQNALAPLGYFEKSNRKKDTTFVISAGAAGQIGYSGIDFWAADDCFTFDDTNNVLSKYIFYFLQTKQTYIDSRVRRGSIPRISRDVFEKMKIPLPKIEVQKRIVDILDRFESLTTDIKAGLPAEIEARHKQYEYYRDKLLTFKRKSA